MELKALGMDRAAEKIRTCGVPNRWHKPRWCRLRCCPNCAAKVGRQLARGLDEYVRMMESPTLTLWTYNTPSRSGLRAAISLFRKCITALRKKKSAARMVWAAGTLEVKRQNDHPGWLVHGHIIVNMTVSDAEERAIDADWRALLRGRGSFKVQRDRPMVDRKKRKKLLRYMTKPETWAPPPGTMPSKYLQELIEGSRGVRTIIRWPLGLWCSPDADLPVYKEEVLEEVDDELIDAGLEAPLEDLDEPECTPPDDDEDDRIPEPVEARQDALSDLDVDHLVLDIF
ncbi:MAG: hypothetical protein EPO40_02125 [Myxococcaceae bacterium]|nr:MAG: hypothetical protein EPO40_02125 [Myxococcaceae bacterium]